MNTMETVFFHTETEVTALPSWSKPRLYIPTKLEARRIKDSFTFYPAFHWYARCYRYILAFKVILGFSQKKKCHLSSNAFWDFLPSDLAKLKILGVLLSNAYPKKKYIVKLFCETTGNIYYLKYVINKHLSQKIEQENLLLTSIPLRTGPKVIKFAPIEQGSALLMEAIPGKTINPYKMPSQLIHDFLSKLILPDCYSISQHPWAKKLRQTNNPEVLSLLQDLSGREWPIVIQHGDFSPWNLINYQGEIRAIDWEYGCLKSFPYLDLIYYCLQISFLMKKWEPRKSFFKIFSHLEKNNPDDLVILEIHALIKLAVYDTFERYGFSDQDPISSWRKKILNIKFF